MPYRDSHSLSEAEAEPSGKFPHRVFGFSVFDVEHDSWVKKYENVVKNKVLAVDRQVSDQLPSDLMGWRMACQGRRPGLARLKRGVGFPTLQTPGARNEVTAELKVVTKRAPTPAELADLLFAWRVMTFVKSDAPDALFPFRDGVDVVVQAGAKAVIQPGGIAVGDLSSFTPAGSVPFQFGPVMA